MVVRGLAELEAAKQLLLTSLRAVVPDEELLGVLQQLEAFRNSLWQADHVLIQAITRAGLAEQHCVSSVEKLIGQALRISVAEARRRVRAADGLGASVSLSGQVLPARYAVLAAAQAAGDVGAAAVDVIVSTLGRVEVVAPSEVAETEVALTGFAEVFDPRELSRIADRVVDHVDPDGSRPRDQVLRARRELVFSRCRDGMVAVQGRLTPAVGARVKAVLGPLSAPRMTLENPPDSPAAGSRSPAGAVASGVERAGRPVPDPRSSAQRMHDALDEACGRLLRAGDVPASGGIPATVIVTMTEPQLRTAARIATPSGTRTATMQASAPTAIPAQTSAASPTTTGDAGDEEARRQAAPALLDLVTVPGGGTVETATGEVLSIAEALRLAGEAEVVSVVLSRKGRPLHLGRTRRYASSAQTLALIARDGGCSFPGCTIPPQWCERHHLVGWAAGGATDVDNLTLLCGYHHAHFAHAGWTAALNSDGLPEWRPPRWQQRQRQPLIHTRIQQLHRQSLEQPLEPPPGSSPGMPSESPSGSPSGSPPGSSFRSPSDPPAEPSPHSSRTADLDPGVDSGEARRRELITV